MAAIGCEKVQGGLVGLPQRQEAVEVFVDLQVEPHVCTETLPTVIGELVRMHHWAIRLLACGYEADVVAK